jgi:hypothetical protein
MIPVETSTGGVPGRYDLVSFKSKWFQALCFRHESFAIGLTLTLYNKALTLLTIGCEPRRPAAVIGTNQPDPSLSRRFSWTVESTPNAPKTEALYQSNNPFSDQIVSRAI